MAAAADLNVLFVFTDDQRFDTVRALGGREVVTPHMDELAGRGVSFTHAHIMGSYTAAVCIASRAMMLTGRGLFHAPRTIPEEVALWPQYVREAGYATFCTGKWHNDVASFARGFEAGDKIFFGGMSNHLKVPVHDFDPAGRYEPERRYIGKKFSSELFTDAAVDFLRRYEREGPFFMYVPYTAPHDPRMAPERYDRIYERGKIPVPRNFMPHHPFDNGEMDVRDERLAPRPRTPEIVREHIAAYYAMITHLDDQLGRLLAALEESGHGGNTLVIFAGDNGLAVGQHGLLGKQNLYDHSVRVPLIMCGPGLPQGQRCDALCYLHEVFPTVCELGGLPVPPTVEGRSLLPAVRGGPAPHDSLFCAYMDVQRAVRDRRYKLIEYRVEGRRTVQIFDTVEDPAETSNLAEDPACADEVERLRAELRRWQEAVDDPRAGDWAG
ncbi:MAG: sulfatase-like hydrolase/transferase [Planctomycetota bacterium]|jgi:arylsulfatase A-like enzyme